MRLENKVAIVTGATSGMGRATAVLFAKEGAKVVVCGRNEERAKAVVDQIKADGGEAIAVLGDASDLAYAEEIVKKTVDAFGTVDILVNNAGMLSMSTLQDVSIEEWDRVFRVNVDSALRLCQLCATIMKEKGKGVIVNVASVASFAAHHGFAAYISSKHGMAGLSKSMAWELGPEIRVNAIAPGMIMTDMLRGVNQDELNALAATIPEGFIGDVSDIAGALGYLLTAPYVTGQVISPNGGFILQ